MYKSASSRLSFLVSPHHLLLIRSASHSTYTLFGGCLYAFSSYNSSPLPILPSTHDNMSKEYKGSDDPESYDNAPSQVGEIVDDRHHDAVFGDITEGAPDYRNVRQLYTFKAIFNILTTSRLAGWEQLL